MPCGLDSQIMTLYDLHFQETKTVAKRYVVRECNTHAGSNSPRVFENSIILKLNASLIKKPRCPVVCYLRVLVEVAEYCQAIPLSKALQPIRCTSSKPLRLPPFARKLSTPSLSSVRAAKCLAGLQNVGQASCLAKPFGNDVYRLLSPSPSPYFNTGPRPPSILSRYRTVPYDPASALSSPQTSFASGHSSKRRKPCQFPQSSRTAVSVVLA